jgi:hypothetical protein
MPMTPPVTDHEPDPGCWCEPVLEHTGPRGSRVYIHRERGGQERPPAAIVAHMRQLADRDGCFPGVPEDYHLTALGTWRKPSFVRLDVDALLDMITQLLDDDDARRR